MNSVKFIVFVLGIGILYAEEESNAQTIVDDAELNELKIKLGEPLSSLRKEYKDLFHNFYLNAIREATKEEFDTGVIYTIKALLGNPPVNCELQLFETVYEYTLHSQCGGYHFKNGIRPITGARIKRGIDEEILVHGLSREVQPDEFPLLDGKIVSILGELDRRYNRRLQLVRIESGQFGVQLGKIARWSLKADFILSDEPILCDVFILEQEWTQYLDVQIKCLDGSEFEIEHGTRED